MIEFIPQTLLANTGVTAIVGNKIKPAGANQGESLPYVTFQTVSARPKKCREGIAQETIRVQVSAFGKSFGEVQTLYRAIRDALDGAKNTDLTCEWMSANDLPYEPGVAFGIAIDFQLLTNK